MALGNRVRRDVGDDGRVVARMVPRDEAVAELDDGLDQAAESRRAHYQLSSAYQADNPNRLVAGVALNFSPGFTFEKYELVVRAAVDVFISFQAGASPDYYDDALVSGMQSRSDRLEPSDQMSLYFDAVPAGGADLYLYAGRAADPT